MIIFSFTLMLLSCKSWAWGLKDFKEESLSPITTEAKYVFWTGSAVTLLLVAFQDEVVDPFQDKQVRNKTLGDSSRFGDWLGQNIPNFLYAGGMAYAGHKDHAIGMFKATSYAAAVTNILKYTTCEPRPNDNDIRNSFPSGHTATAFAFSGFVTAEHGWWWGGASLLMSTFVAYSRINDNDHRLHDVTFGATLGWTYGWGISRLTMKNENIAYIMPILDSKTAGISMYKEF